MSIKYKFLSVIFFLSFIAFSYGQSSCVSGNECKSGYCLNGKCVPTKSNGTACTSGDECDSGYCLNGKCTPTKSNCSTCSGGRECKSGYCLNGICTETKN